MAIAPLDSAAVQNYRITLHGLRSGCAISLAMSGTDLQTITATSVGNHGYSMSPLSDGASSKVRRRRRLVIRITFGPGGTLSQTKRANGLNTISKFF